MTKTSRFGTIRALPSGRYQARYRLNTGEQITAGVYDSAVIAQQALDAIEVDMRRGDHWDDRKSKTRFRDYMVEYMAFREAQVAGITYRNDRSLLKLHLLPTFGHLQMRDFDTQTVDQWWQRMPVSQTRKNAYFLLKKALAYAVRWGYLKTSPATVETPGADVSEKRPTWHVDDFRRVLANVPTHIRMHNSPSPVPVVYKEALEVLFAGHLRLGELIALDVTDYDRRTGVIRVTKQRTDLGVTTGTKTGQEKEIELAVTGIAAMNRLPARIGTGPLFTGPRGGRLPRATLRNAWDEAVAAAGYENFHLHDLRHVGLSLLGQARRPLAEIMYRGGHSTVTSAMRYQHTDADRDSAAAAAMNKLLG